MIGLLPAALTAQSVNQQALQSYNRALSNLKTRPQLASVQALKAAEFAEDARNTNLQAGSYLLAGKAFLAQNDFDNASLFIKRGIQKGKSIKSVPLVIEGSTLLSSISVRQEQYRQAYEQVLQGINYYNSYPKSGKIRGNLKDAERKKLNKQIQSLKAKERKLHAELSTMSDQLNSSKKSFDSLAIVTALKQHLSKDSSNKIAESKTEPKLNEDLDDEPTSIGSKPKKRIWGLAMDDWILLLSLLSLGLLGGLIWQTIAKRRFRNEANLYKENTSQLPASDEAITSKWESELQSKERLIADYENELSALKEKNVLANSLFNNGNQQSARKLKSSIMLVEIDSKEKEQLNSKKVYQLDRELQLIIKQNPSIHFINKMGPTLLFVSHPKGIKKGPQALVDFGEELKEYFDDLANQGWIAKIAVHSGPLIFTQSDELPKGIDVWGEELDCCNWLLKHTQPGHLTITSDARDQLAKPEGWTYLGEQKDFKGKAMRIFKKS